MRGAFVFVVLLALFAGCTAGDDPCALVARTTVPLHLTPLGPVVDLDLDGRIVPVLLDTGAGPTLVTANTAARLGLPTDWANVTMQTGIGGSTVSYGVKVAQTRIGDLVLTDAPIAVGRFELPSAGGTVGGILGNSILSQFDVELDLAAGTMTLYRPRACPDPAPPWQAEALRLARPVAAPANRNPYIAMQIDGRDIAALIDTGASVSMVDAGVLAALGEEVSRPGEYRISVRGASPNAAQARLHRFREVRLAGNTGHDVTMPVAALPGGTGALIGMDVLHHRRVYIAYDAALVYLGQRSTAQ
jgi:predicted aspartyl protease